MYNMAMVVTILVRYSIWHYAQAPKLILSLWKNMLWYIGHIFSVGTLMKSLFTPWKRIVAKRNKKWNFDDIASAILANFLSRIIGAVMRLFLVAIGRIMQLIVIVLGFIFYLSWFILPVLIAVTFLYGLSLII